MTRVSSTLVKRLDKLQARAEADVGVAYFPSTMDADEWECIAIKQQAELMRWVTESHNWSQETVYNNGTSDRRISHALTLQFADVALKTCLVQVLFW